MITTAIMRLDPLLDLAELSRELVTAKWQEIYRERWWDGVDYRCRLDNMGPYR